MNVKNDLSKTPMQHTIQYTIVISVIYVIFKFFDTNSPDGKEFIYYILPALFSNVVLLVFPMLFVFFYFKDGKAVQDIFNKNNCDMNEVVTREELREYHSMMKEGIITQDEFDIIKKKALKKLNETQ